MANRGFFSDPSSDNTVNNPDVQIKKKKLSRITTSAKGRNGKTNTVNTSLTTTTTTKSISTSTTTTTTTNISTSTTTTTTSINTSTTTTTTTMIGILLGSFINNDPIWVLASENGWYQESIPSGLSNNESYIYDNGDFYSYSIPVTFSGKTVITSSTNSNSYYYLTRDSNNTDIVFGSFDVNIFTYSELNRFQTSIYYFSDNAGGSSSFIINGGSNMYSSSGGNFINTNIYNTVPYTHTQLSSYNDSGMTFSNFIMDGSVSDGTNYFGPSSSYFTNLYPGLFVMLAKGVTISNFNISGNLGSANYPFAGNYSDNYQFTISDTYTKDYTVFVSRQYNAYAPSVNHIIIVDGDGTGITHSTTPFNFSDYDSISNLSEITEIHYLLMSKPGDFLVQLGQGLPITESQINSIVNNYLSLVDGLGITQSLSNLNQNYQNVTSVLPTPDENDFPMNLDPQSLTYYEDTIYGAASTQILDGFVEQDVPPGGCFLVQYSMTGSVLDANFATGLPSLLFVYQSELWSISYGGTGSYWFLSPYSEPPQFNYLTFGPVPSGTFSKYWDIQTINGYGNDVYFTATYWDETENMYDGLFQVDMTTFFVSYVSNADGIYNLFIV